MRDRPTLWAAALRRARQIRQMGKAIIKATSAHTLRVIELPREVSPSSTLKVGCYCELLYHNYSLCRVDPLSVRLSVLDML